ncbi:hypothetical protein COL26b_014360 [Colletotrichum chrysophilum]|uniref:uncharacterized protein n=1 Tax=Colletotrichum chrysophilum TaxID=1836956 RepID=UPI00230182F1|nr:uncharacterized protein COL26b_014360 [Colletotrichum chrysophilum]KAJ0359429.1 hypothetical protein COL26b_014360 [Colletotrichum chrysophilum]
MQEIQTTTIQLDKSLDFVRNLECLRPADVGYRDEFERVRINVFNEECAGGSYTWSPAHYESGEAGACHVRTRDGKKMEPSQVRDSVLRRAKAYMRHVNVKYLWIDKECIVQDSSEEKEKAFHAMDLVYRGK